MTRRVVRTVDFAFRASDVSLSFPQLLPILDPQTVFLSVVSGRAHEHENWHAVALGAAEARRVLLARA